MDECRAGLRRYAGIQRGDHYQHLLAHLGEGDYNEPSVHERRLGDLLHPLRSGRMVDVVNVVTRESGVEAADWRIDRLLSMMAGIQKQNRQGQPAE